MLIIIQYIIISYKEILFCWLVERWWIGKLNFEWCQNYRNSWENEGKEEKEAVDDEKNNNNKKSAPLTF